MVRPPSDAKVSDEEKELGSVVGVLYFKVFNRPSFDDEAEFKFLARISKAVFSEKWTESPNGALIDLLRVATGRLPADEFPDDFDKSWRWIGETLYGYRKDLPKRPEGLPHTYKSRWALVKELYDKAKGVTVAEKTFRRHIILAIRATLVSILRELEREAEQGKYPSFCDSSSTPAQPQSVTVSAELPVLHRQSQLLVLPQPVLKSQLLRHAPHQLDRGKRISQVRLTLGVVILVLIGAVIGLLAVPRFYEPSQVWEGPFRGPSVFVVSSFRLLAPVVCVAAILVVWMLTTALINWRPLSRRRAILCMAFVLVALAPVYLVGVVDFAHRRETREAAALPHIGSGTAFLYQNQNFDRVNNPDDYTAACTDNPVTYTPVGAGAPTAVLEGDLNPELCDEFNGVLTLYTWGSINAYDGDEREGVSRDFYVETMFRPSGFVLWAGCSISIIPVDDTDTSQNFTLEVAQDDPVRYRAAVVEYKSRGGEQESRRVQQRSSLALTTKVGDDTEFDQSPREGWLKLGVLREGSKYKLFVNDHLMLTYAGEGSPELVRVQVEAHGNPHKGIGYAGCQFDYLRQWMFAD